jgi:hypothetical protein
VFADSNPYRACAYSAATRSAPFTTSAIMEQLNSVGDLHQVAQLRAGRVSALDGAPCRPTARSRATFTGSLARSRPSDPRPKGSATGAAQIGLRKLHTASTHSTEPCQQSGERKAVHAGPPRRPGNPVQSTRPTAASLQRQSSSVFRRTSDVLLAVIQPEYSLINICFRIASSSRSSSTLSRIKVARQAPQGSQPPRKQGARR